MTKGKKKRERGGYVIHVSRRRQFTSSGPWLICLLVHRCTVAMMGRGCQGEGGERERQLWTVYRQLKCVLRPRDYF